MLVASDFGGRARPFVNIVLLFTLIPTILGAWMSGSRGALRWAGFAILVNFVIEGVWLVLGRTAPANESSSHWFTFGGFLAQSIVMVMVCYFVGVLADRQRTEHAQLEHANTLLIEQTHMREQLAASQERMRLSRDLHDTVAHTLAALSVQMNAVSAVLEGEQPTIAVRRELDVARTLVKEGLENTRRAITDLRVNQVADFGLSGALQKQTEALAQRTGIEATFERLGPEPTLSDDVADTIFRIAQEALNNVEMHAAAQRVVVVLDHHVTKPRKVMLTIQDDGRGFDVDEILDTERFGLRGMRERAQLIGAHLRVDSQSHTGTKVILDLKL
jgi:signal transduction histidine kinase